MPDKGLLLVLFPFFTVILIMGFLVLYTRRGRPVNLRLKGLGIEFVLQGRGRPGDTCSQDSLQDKEA